MKTSDIYLDERTVGYAEYCKEGLYLHISAKCFDIPTDFYRLIIHTQSGFTDLGVGICQNGVFVWNKRIPLRSISGEIMRYTLQANGQNRSLDFIAVDPEKPFPYFHKIPKCIYKEETGKKGICIMQDP